MSQDDGPQVTPNDAVRVAQNALQKANQNEATIASQETYIKQLERRIEQLELIVPDATDYENLDRADKGALVRDHLVRTAQDRNGKAKVDYHEIKHGVFDGQPSNGHCFDLMEIAARKAGFEVKNPSDGNKHVRVDLAQTSHETSQRGLSRTKNE